MNSSCIRRFRRSNLEEINANCGRTVPRSAGKCPIQRITKEMGSAALRHRRPRCERSPGRPNGNIGPFPSPESGSWSVTQSLAGTRSEVWFFQIFRSAQHTKLNFIPRTGGAARFEWQHLHFWALHGRNALIHLFSSALLSALRILFVFIWAWAVSWAFIPQLEINLIKALRLSLANPDSFCHVFSVIWSVLSFRFEVEIRISMSKDESWNFLYFPLISMEQRLWMAGKEKLGSEELCCHQAPAEADLGVRTFIQSPVGLFVDLAVSPGVALPSRWLHLNKP